jgi:hypothetical protein
LNNVNEKVGDPDLRKEKNKSDQVNNNLSPKND